MKNVFGIFICLMIVGCATMPSVQQMDAKAYVAKFDYTPASQVGYISGGVSFAVAGATYKTNNKEWLWMRYPQFINLDDAVKSDFSDLLVSKGFSVRGSFESYDLIPYSEKKNIDMLLVPQIELSITIKDPNAVIENIWAAPPIYIHTGIVEVSGKVTVELREIATRELMWSKNIPFEKYEFPYRIRNCPGYDQQHGIVFDLKPILTTDVAKGVEAQYQKIMTTIATLIDAEEMKILKKQCQEVRKEKMPAQGTPEK
jgi:hypothetical protein